MSLVVLSAKGFLNSMGLNYRKLKLLVQLYVKVARANGKFEPWGDHLELPGDQILGCELEAPHPKGADSCFGKVPDEPVSAEVRVVVVIGQRVVLLKFKLDTVVCFGGERFEVHLV